MSGTNKDEPPGQSQRPPLDGGRDEELDPSGEPGRLPPSGAEPKRTPGDDVDPGVG